jgi:hypothetical protein
VGALRQRTIRTGVPDAIRLSCWTAFLENAEVLTSRFGRLCERVKRGARAALVIPDYWPSTFLEKANAPHHMFWGAVMAHVHRLGKVLLTLFNYRERTALWNHGYS